MSVLLFILKLIGIVLLVILGLILVAVALVLIVPVRYQISGQIEDEMAVHAKITWLLHAISYTLDFQEGEVYSCLRILGVRKKPGAKSALDDEPDDIMNEEDELDRDDKFDGDSERGTEFESDIEGNSKSEYELRTEEKSGFATIKAKIETFIEILRKIKQMIPQMLDKASSLKEIIVDEMNQFVLKQVLAELKYLLVHFKFRKLVTDLRFATGDPATTGQALGVLCMLPVLYQYQVSIVPDFESEEFYVKGTFDIKGYMRGIHAIRSLLRLIKQKEVRIFLQKISDR